VVDSARSESVNANAQLDMFPDQLARSEGEVKRALPNEKTKSPLARLINHLLYGLRHKWPSFLTFANESTSVSHKAWFSAGAVLLLSAFLLALLLFLISHRVYGTDKFGASEYSAAIADSKWHVQWPGQVPPPSPEQPGRGEGRSADALYLLLKTFQADGQYVRALDTAELLVRQYPHFQLGQLAYAELLAQSSSGPNVFEGLIQEKEKSSTKRLAELQLESKLRQEAALHAVSNAQLPQNLLHLSKDIPNVIVVDASRSRLYWFTHREERAPSQQPTIRLLTDHYVSVGHAGIGKLLEGDGKTPLGVYFIRQKIQSEKLPDLYGVGALTLNYPNALDVWHRRTGSGIWLHGTFKSQYARPPQSTDGCVVLANPDMERLLDSPQMRSVPVIIADKLDWVANENIQSERESFQRSLDAWVTARFENDMSSLKGHYSERYMRHRKGLSEWWPQIEKAAQIQSAKDVQVQGIFQFRDKEPITLTVLKLPNRGSKARDQQMLVYWAKEGRSWKILTEETL
jgi:L,D-transpeptidase YnhG